MTPSIRIALDDLNLERVTVIYPGAKCLSLTDRVSIVSLETLAESGRLFEEESR